MDAKKQIHLQFEAGKMDDNYQWEYRFYDDGYEIIGKNEKSRVKYDNVGRLIDMSGMYVIVERGNVVRYFMKDDAVQGNSTELAGFPHGKMSSSDGTAHGTIGGAGWNQYTQ